jgi:mediator of RNA polymerase II transcription subunit 12, fungi type
VNTGLRFIATTLNNADYTKPDFLRAIDIVSEQLRLLAHITEPVRDAQNAPLSDSTTQDEFLQALVNKINIFEAVVSGQNPAPSFLSRERIMQTSILFARLLQFDLACRNIWTPKTRELSGNLCMTIFRLALVSIALPEVDQSYFFSGIWFRRAFMPHLICFDNGYILLSARRYVVERNLGSDS